MKRNFRFASTFALTAILLIEASASLAASYRPARLSNQRGSSAAAESSPAPKFEIPFENVTGHIFLKVNVKGAGPFSFIFDTGNPYAILDMSRAKELGVDLHGSLNVSGAGEGSQTAEFANDCPYTIPGLDGFSGRVTLALPLDILRPHLGHDVDGILGADFIRQFVIEVDYISNVMKFYDKVTYKYSGAGEAIPITFNRASHPIIKAQLIQPGRPPIDGNFVVDLGSAGSLILNRPFVDQEHLLAPDQKTIKVKMGGGIGGGISGLIGRVSALKFGGFTIERPLTLFSTDEKGVMATAAFFQGNIGFRVLRKFKVILDYADKQIILEPNSRFKEPIEFLAGFSLVTDLNNYKLFQIENIAEGSPAIDAGLREHDVITAVDGAPASKLTLTEIEEMFQRPGDYSVEVKRGDQTLKVKLKLHPLI